MIGGKLLFSLKLSLNGFLLGLSFVMNGAGAPYGIGPLRRLRMVLQVKRNAQRITSASNWRQHILMVEDILKLPQHLKGDAVECGCFNGSATTSLSLACAATGRRLFVCDSFEGLPDPEDYERTEAPAGFPNQWTYEAGQLASEGGLNGVRDRVAQYGDVSCCTFVKGFFSDTLDDLDTESIAFVFADADLRSSTEDCVRSLWPKMSEGSKFFCHEPFSTHVVSLFYDSAWWKEHLDSYPPGFFGSGAGIIEVLKPSGLGFALKYQGKQKGRDDLDLVPTRSGVALPSFRGIAEEPHAAPEAAPPGSQAE